MIESLIPASALTQSDVDRHRVAEEATLHLAAIVSDSDDAIITKNLDGIITSWNSGAERLFGYTHSEMIGQPVTKLIPAARIDEEPTILAQLRAGQRIEHYETVRQKKDGSLLDISLTVSPLRDSQGVIIGASKIARDVSHRRRAAEQQALLLGEMQHRIRNLFSVIEAIARQSRPRNDPAVDAYIDTLMARLRAFCSSNELTFGSSASCAPILNIARAALAPFTILGQHPNIVISGADISVSEQTAAGLGLAFHELETNAIKYGALKTPTGRTSLTCKAEPNNGRTKVSGVEGVRRRTIAKGA